MVTRDACGCGSNGNMLVDRMLPKSSYDIVKQVAESLDGLAGAVEAAKVFGQLKTDIEDDLDNKLSVNVDPTALVNGGPMEILSAVPGMNPSARGIVHAYDTAVLGNDSVALNPNLTGSPVDNAVYSNFTPTSVGVSHNAGTVASLQITINSVRNSHYKIKPKFHTVTEGTYTLFIAGQPLIGEKDYFGAPVEDDVVYDFSWFSNNLEGPVTIEVRTDAVWAGSLLGLDVIKVQQTTPYDIFSISADNKLFANPFGIKFGRFSSGNISIGDTSTGATLTEYAAWNTLIGSRAGASLTDQIEATYNGALAGEFSQVGQNSAFGYSASRMNKTGKGNASFGFKCLYRGNGSRNTGHGYLAGLQNELGNDLALFGWQAGYNSKGSRLTIMGSQAGQQNGKGNDNTWVGAISGPYSSNSNGVFSFKQQTCLGSQSKAYGDGNLVGGYLARAGTDPLTGGTIVSSTVVLGELAVAESDDSVVVGGNANLSGTGNIRGTIVGSNAKGTGLNVCVYGFLASANTGTCTFGSQAGKGQKGTFNTNLGYYAGSSEVETNYSNSMSIGANASADKNNQMVLGDANVDEFVLGGVVITKAKLIALLAMVNNA